MTAGERLQQLAGASGVAAALLLTIGAGSTSGAALVNYSELLTGTAAEHLLVDHAPDAGPGAMFPGSAMVGGGHRPSFRNRQISEIARDLQRKLKKKNKRQEEEELLFSTLL